MTIAYQTAPCSEKESVNQCPSEITFNQDVNLFNNEHDSDISFLVGKSDGTAWRFPGHTRILNAANNNQLQNLFQTIPASRSIVLNDIEPRGFEQLLRYLYGLDIELKSVQTALETLETSVKFECTPLIHQSIKYLDAQLTPENVLYVLPVLESKFQNEVPQIEALLHNCLVLVDEAANEVLSSEMFEELSRGQVEMILRRNSLHIQEIDAWNALARWLDRTCKKTGIESKNTEKRKVLGTTADVIRYSLMSREEFMAGPAPILHSLEHDKILHKMKNKDKYKRNGRIPEPIVLSDRSSRVNESKGEKYKKRRRSSGESQGKWGWLVDCFCRIFICIID